jgi:hypothetical protein
MYGDQQSVGMCVTVLADTEGQPVEKCLQLELQVRRSVSNFDTTSDTNPATNAFFTTPAAAT